MKSLNVRYCGLLKLFGVVHYSDDVSRKNVIVCFLNNVRYLKVSKGGYNVFIFSINNPLCNIISAYL